MKHPPHLLSLPVPPLMKIGVRVSSVRENAQKLAGADRRPRHLEVVAFHLDGRAGHQGDLGDDGSQFRSPSITRLSTTDTTATRRGLQR